MAEKLRKGFLKYYRKAVALGMIIMMMATYVSIVPAKAAALTTIKDTLSDSRAATVANHTIVFTSTTAIPSVTGTIVIDFPAGFDLTNETVADMTLTDTVGARTLADTNPTATADGVVVDYNNETITITMCSTATATCAIEATNVVTFTLAGVTNPATGVYQIDIDTTSDSGSAAVAIVASGVAVSATIDAYMTFAIDDYAVGFGSWTGGSTVKRWATADPTVGATSQPTAPFTLTVSTKAS